MCKMGEFTVTGTYYCIALPGYDCHSLCIAVDDYKSH